MRIHCAHEPPRRDHGQRPTFLLAVRPDLLDGLHTCVVAPLGRAAAGGKPVDRLMPGVPLDGEAWWMRTPQLAAMPRTILRRRVGKPDERAPAIAGALDFLFSGI